MNKSKVASINLISGPSVNDKMWFLYESRTRFITRNIVAHAKMVLANINNFSQTKTSIQQIQNRVNLSKNHAKTAYFSKISLFLSNLFFLYSKNKITPISYVTPTIAI